MEHRRDVPGGDIRACTACGSCRGPESASGSQGVWTLRCATLTLQLVQITGQAKTKRRKKEAQLSVVVAAEKADLKIEPADPQRKLLSVQLKQFLADTIDRGSLEAAEVYELACDEFLQVIGRQYM